MAHFISQTVEGGRGGVRCHMVCYYLQLLLLLLLLLQLNLHFALWPFPLRAHFSM